MRNAVDAMTVRAQARNALEALLSTILPYFPEFGAPGEGSSYEGTGHFQRWWDVQHDRLKEEGLEWKMERDGSLERATKAEQYVTAFFEILRTTADGTQHPRPEQLGPLVEALNEPCERVLGVRRRTFRRPEGAEWAGEVYRPLGTTWREAAQYLLDYLNLTDVLVDVYDEKPVHRLCESCGKLSLPRKGSAGRYCSNRCREIAYKQSPLRKETRRLEQVVRRAADRIKELEGLGRPTNLKKLSKVTARKEKAEKKLESLTEQRKENQPMEGEKT
jgi:hypothetical protein